MNKSKGKKATFQFVVLLLCMVLIHTAFASENQNQFTMNFIDNSTSENTTIENSTTENATIEDPIIENALLTILDPSYYYTYIAVGKKHRNNCEFH